MKLTLTFYVTTVVTIMYMLAIVTGSLDSEAGSYYLGGAGFLILFYIIRSYLMIRRSEKLDRQKLSGFEKFCGYIGMLNGFFFLALGVIFVIISIVQFQFRLGETLILIILAIYGYSMLYYIWQTLKKLR